MRTEQPIKVSQFYLVHQAFKKKKKVLLIDLDISVQEHTRYLGGGDLKLNRLRKKIQ